MTTPGTLLQDLLSQERLNRLDTVLANRSRSICIVLDRIRNPHNISAVLRSADAFGIQDIHLIGDEFLYAKGISLGSERWLTLHRYQNPAEVIPKLKGFTGVTLEALGTGKKISMPVYELPFDKPLALIFGNERGGVSEELRDFATIAAHIPMLGFVESLNISVAAAITLFCSLTSNTTGERRLRPLNEPEKSELRDKWITQSVREGEAVLKEISAREAQQRKIRE